MKKYRSIFWLMAWLGLSALACSLGGSGGSSSSTAEPPRDATVVEVLANASLKPWLETAVNDFNTAQSQNDKPIFVQLTITESGQAVTDIVDGRQTPALWIPEESVWTSILADQGNTDYQADCVSTAKSPLVIAMWRPVAKSLGWPSLPLGWLDIGSLAGDAGLWRYYSGGTYGDTLRLSHTHPGLSGTGTSALLALVQAAQSQTNAVTVEEIQQPIVQASVGAFESAVAWFGSSSDDLAQTMSSRGNQYLGAAVMYEATVLEYGKTEIVPVYPLEGTFVADFPACVNGAASGDVQTALTQFRAYLLSDAGQQTAVTHGLRPVNPNVAVTAPLDEAHGVDLAQPQQIFAPPSVQTVYAVQALWQSARKDVNLVLVIDTSGSMRGSKMENVKTAAIQFVQQMGEEDYLSIVAFSAEPSVLVTHQQVGPNREKLVKVIEQLVALGDTTLFDAIGDSTTLLAQTQQPDTTNAMVVLSDGQDTRSYRYGFNSILTDGVINNNITLFLIAYGSDADEAVLGELATRVNGNFFQGDEASIAAIYQEMSAAFGGSVGVGR